MEGLEEIETLVARHRTLKRRQHFFQNTIMRINATPGTPKREKCKNLNYRTQEEIKRVKIEIRDIQYATDSSMPGLIRRGRRFIREIPFEELYTTYKDHERLQLFVLKGTACIHPKCDKVGTRLLLTVDYGGREHVDLFTNNLHLMTNDHIIPKSRGGSEEMSNKQPMCEHHNVKKSNKLVPY